MSNKTAVSSSDFELVSGLEIHVQLNTNTKIFSSDSAAFGAKPNEHISAVSLALPGALPKLNKEVVEKEGKVVYSKTSKREAATLFGWLSGPEDRR